MSHRILLVEDDLSLRMSLRASLRAEGYEVVAVASAEEAEQAVDEERFHLVVLDWMLPGRSGFEQLQRWRAAGHALPVVLLTARGAVRDRVDGLRGGADDYLVKPFATEELLARIGVRLQRRVTHHGVLQLDRGQVDLRREVVISGAEATPLTTTEARLLAYLAERPGVAVERAELLREVWGYRGGQPSRSVDNTVLRLRPKIELDPSRPRHLITVYGVGYRFEPG